MATYAEKLKDVRWQKKRLEIFQRDNWMCVKCGQTEGCMHVHHKQYHNVQPWEYDSSFLEAVCEKCHAAEHPEHSKVHYRPLPKDWSFAHPTNYTDPDLAEVIHMEIKDLQQQLIGADSEKTQIILNEILKLQEAKKRILKK